MLSFYQLLGLREGLFPLGLPIKILKSLLPSSILAKCSAQFNRLDYIGERYILRLGVGSLH